ncbi:MAG: inorganic phosphate transporter [Elusimicrobia bacterium]|nr:inorganic phosphate transporter [Elusimicrobiota bacterium]
MTSAGLFGAALLAFANGANDISKSIATLVGSGESDYKRAVVLTSFAVAAGAVLASAWAIKMTLLFTKGMLLPQTQINQLFAMAVLAGAIGWVLLATRLGLPVSTTHAIVGSVILTAVYAFGFSSVLWSGVTTKVFLPLLLSPVLAFGLARLAFRSLFWLCRQKYCLNCHWAHWMSAMSSGFARGLNDTPKIAALGLVFYFLADPVVSVAPRWFFLVLALSNALGGIVMGLKVTETLAHKVTRMDHLEGFAANLATAALTVATAVHGFPVSTTHVSSSAIMGMGLRKGTAAIDWKVAGEILAAWLITLPAAGILGAGAYWTLKWMPASEVYSLLAGTWRTILRQVF